MCGNGVRQRFPEILIKKMKCCFDNRVRGIARQIKVFKAVYRSGNVGIMGGSLLIRYVVGREF